MSLPEAQDNVVEVSEEMRIELAEELDSIPSSQNEDQGSLVAAITMEEVTCPVCHEAMVGYLFFRFP